jgi:hypothetical protein
MEDVVDTHGHSPWHFTDQAKLDLVCLSRWNNLKNMLKYIIQEISLLSILNTRIWVWGQGFSLRLRMKLKNSAQVGCLGG